MHSRIHNSIRDALSSVKKSNVNEATAVILAALMGNEIESPNSTSSTGSKRSRLAIGQRRKTFEITSGLTTPPQRHDEFSRASSARAKLIDPVGNFTSGTYQHIKRSLDYMLYVPSNKSTQPQTARTSRDFLWSICDLNGTKKFSAFKTVEGRSENDFVSPVSYARFIF